MTALNTPFYLKTQKYDCNCSKFSLMYSTLQRNLIFIDFLLNKIPNLPQVFPSSVLIFKRGQTDLDATMLSIDLNDIHMPLNSYTNRDNIR